MDNFDYKKVAASILTPNLEGAPIDNPFYNKKIVFTGDLAGWDRSAAASILQQLGADINTSISSKTNIVILGQGVGPKKLEKVIDLLADGYSIKLMNERIFNKELDPYKDFLKIS